ncbi:hypothetical protein ACWEH1_25835, partial [Micromonospora chersina]
FLGLCLLVFCYNTLALPPCWPLWSTAPRGGVVTSRRDGKTVFYRADRDGAIAALTDLQSYLATCC